MPSVTPKAPGLVPKMVGPQKILPGQLRAPLPTQLERPEQTQKAQNRALQNHQQWPQAQQWGNDWAPIVQMMMMMKGKGKGKGGCKGGGLNDFSPEKKAWVGGIPDSVTFKELQEHFDTVVKSKWAEVWKNGLGGVAFGTVEDCEKAIATLDGSVLAGATLKVDVWTGKEKKADADGELEGDEGGSKKKRKWSGGGDWRMSKMMKAMSGWGSWGPWEGGSNWGGGGSWRGAEKPIDESGGLLGEFEGKIKSFSDEKGWGFIECPDVKAQYDRDVFLYFSQKKDYRVGHKVKFTCVLNKDGMPAAKDLKSGLK